MNLYLKQKIFTLRDKFEVYDENQNPVLSVEGKMVSAHQKHYIYDNAGNEVAYVHEKVLSLMPKFYVERPLGQTHEVKGKFAFLHEKMVVEDLDWVITGKLLEHDYKITKDDQEIASIHQKWLAWGDTYEILVASGIDEVLVLAVIICVDVLHKQQAAVDSAGASNNNSNSQ